MNFGFDYMGGGGFDIASKQRTGREEFGLKVEMT